MADYTSTHTGSEIDAGITKTETLSGTNTGDQDLSGYEPLKGVDDNYVTDAEKVVIGNTSNTNTGDQDVSAKVDSVQEAGVGSILDNILRVTQAQYNGLTPDSSTVYFIVG